MAATEPRGEGALVLAFQPMALVDHLFSFPSEASVRSLPLSGALGGSARVSLTELESIVAAAAPASSQHLTSAGGSTANAARGLAGLGARVRLAGAAGDDEWGAAFARAVAASGADARLVARVPGAPTARCAVLSVEGSSQRTMRTCAEGAARVAAAEAEQLVRRGLEGGGAGPADRLSRRDASVTEQGLCSSPPPRPIFLTSAYALYVPDLLPTALAAARAGGARTALDLGSFECVRAHWPALRAALRAGLVDTVLANEDEAATVAELEAETTEDGAGREGARGEEKGAPPLPPFPALSPLLDAPAQRGGVLLSRLCAVAVVTAGDKGCAAFVQDAGTPTASGSSASAVAPAASGSSASAVAPAASGSSAPAVAPAASGSSASAVAPAASGSSASAVAPAASGSSASAVAPAASGSSASAVAPAASGSSASAVAPAASGSSASAVASSGPSPGRVPAVFASPALSSIAVVDPTGAGDLFDAGFLYARALGASVPQALRAGCLAGAAVVQAEGATLDRSGWAWLRERMDAERKTWNTNA